MNMGVSFSFSLISSYWLLVKVYRYEFVRTFATMCFFVTWNLDQISLMVSVFSFSNKLIFATSLNFFATGIVEKPLRSLANINDYLHLQFKLVCAYTIFS